MTEPHKMKTEIFKTLVKECLLYMYVHVLSLKILQLKIQNRISAELEHVHFSNYDLFSYHTTQSAYIKFLQAHALLQAPISFLSI